LVKPNFFDKFYCKSLEFQLPTKISLHWTCR